MCFMCTEFFKWGKCFEFDYIQTENNAFFVYKFCTESDSGQTSTHNLIIRWKTHMRTDKQKREPQ